MSIISLIRDWRVKKAEEKRLKELDAQLMKKRLLAEIRRAQISASTMEAKMDRKLQVACNKAFLAKRNGEKQILKNAYIDIKTALYFRKVAQGLETALDRLLSNLEFANIADGMTGTLEKASSLTGMNPTIDVAKLSLLYDKVMGPLEMLTGSLGDFSEMNLDSGFECMDISDEEVERVIASVSASPSGKLTDAQLNSIKAPGAEFVEAGGSGWTDDAADYISNMMKKYGFKG